MRDIVEYAVKVFALETYAITPVTAHPGGRNLVFVCTSSDGGKKVLRISALGDREEESYLAETEFVHYLAQNGAPVADVCASVNGNYVESCLMEGKTVFISVFEYAKGMLLVDNGYRYREGAPLEEYFFNTGKALGKIHQLSKEFEPKYRRAQYFERYNVTYIEQLIPDEYADLKAAIAQRLEAFRALRKDKDTYGLVHFDFSDGNYHIDMSSGDLTVFDFDNCIHCWYMFDLANLFTHGEGWCRFEPDPQKRMAIMQWYFNKILEGYRTENDISEESLKDLQLFIDMVHIENIIDEFEGCACEGEEMDYEDIEDAAECLIHHIPFAGICEA